MTQIPAGIGRNNGRNGEMTVRHQTDADQADNRISLRSLYALCISHDSTDPTNICQRFRCSVR